MAAQAQGMQFRFNNYSVEDGLSQSTVYSVTQDSTGYIWMATRDGLNRFDGHSFRIFRPKSKEEHSLPERTVRVLQGKGNYIWAGTDGGGVVRLNSSSEKFDAICSLLEKKECRDNLNVLSLEVDDNNIWAGTRDAGLVKYNLGNGDITSVLNEHVIWALVITPGGDVYAGTSSGLYVLKKSNGKPQKVFSGHIKSLYLEEKGMMWIGTETTGAYQYDTSNHTLITNREIRNKTSGLSINAILKDSKGRTWFGTHSEGILILNQEGNHLERVRSGLIMDRQVEETSIRSLFQDRSGVIWAGMNTSGVSNYSEYRYAFEHYFKQDNDQSLSGNTVLSFEEISESRMLVGTERFGLNVFNKEDKTFSSPRFLSETTVVTMSGDSAGKLWIGSDGKGLFVSNGRAYLDFQEYRKISGMSDESVLSILHLDRENTLAGTYHGLNWIRNGRVVRQFYADENNERALNDDRILSLFKDSKNRIWAGSYSGGLSLFDLDQGTFQNFTEEEHGLSSNRVQVVYEDTKHRLWIGTYNGLNLMNPQSGEFRLFNEDNGLPSNVIYGILEDDNGMLWISTNNGISKFNPATLGFENFTISDGLQSNEFNGGAYYESNEGKFYFGGVNGFNSFDPLEIPVNQFVPNTVIHSFSVEGERVGLTDSKEDLQFNYKQSYFLVNFSVLDYNKPDKHEYRYKLEGLSNEWIHIGTNRSVNFSGLQPGNYRFIVQGTNGDNVWGNPSQALEFTIKPPLWDTAAFKILGAFFLVLLLYLAYRYRTFYLLKEERTRTRIARDLHDDLSATLSSISFFSEAARRKRENLKESGKYMDLIDRSAAEAKEKINDIIWAIDPEKDDWDIFSKKCKRFAADAFDSVNMEYELDFESDINIPLKLELRQNLWLIFKEMINNLVKHSGAEKAHVVFKQKNKEVYLEVKDNGRGFDSNQSRQGHGVKNIKYRATQIGATAEIKSEVGQGTQWIVKLNV